MQFLQDLSGRWQAEVPGLGHFSVLLPGTLDENHIGAADTPGLATRLTRRFTWEGEALFRRELELPEFPGRRLFLLAERSRELTLEVQGQTVPAAVPGTLSTPYLFELTPWAGQTISLTLCSDNRYRTWPRESILNSSAATDETQTNWNGIVGHLCLLSAPEQALLAARVYPGQDRVDVAVDLLPPPQGLPRDAELLLECPAFTEPFRSAWDGEGDTCRVRKIPLSPDAVGWSPASPRMQPLTVTLCRGGQVLDRLQTSFGIRVFDARDGRLCCNGQPVFLRGEANCAAFPKTGHPPMEREAWADIFDRYRAYGVNFVRFHSWCPPRAAFAAADECGMLLQPELSQWNFKDALEVPGGVEYYSLELEQILREYANHPSFVMLTLGNELGTGEQGHRTMNALLDLARRLDATRLYANSSNGHYGEQGPDLHSDFFTAMADRGRMLRATSSPLIGHLNEQAPDTLHHYGDVTGPITRTGMPVFEFEVGQYESWPDFTQLEEFTGVTRAVNLEQIRDLAQRTGAERYWEKGVRASGELALRCYREEAEAALRTPGISGLCLLGLQDFPGQGTSPVGMMDACLQPKPFPFAQPERFRAFFGDVVLLAGFSSYTWEGGQSLSARVQVANYGAEALQGPVCWQLKEKSEVLAEGRTGETNFPCGNVSEAGNLQCILPGDDHAHALTLRLTLGGYTAEYPLWCYPACEKPAPEGILVLDSVSEADLRRIEAGATAFVELEADGAHYPGSVACHFSTDFWSPVTFPEQSGTMGLLIQNDHPALAEYPTDFHSDWQWWAPSRGRAMVLPRAAEPIVRVLDHCSRLRDLGLLVEVGFGKGRILLSGMGLRQHPDRPECRWLRRCLLRYLQTPAPAPLYPADEALLRSWIAVEK